MKIRQKKMNVLVCSRNQNKNRARINMCEVNVNQVQEFCYLGNQIST